MTYAKLYFNGPEKKLILSVKTVALNVQILLRKFGFDHYISEEANLLKENFAPNICTRIK